MTGLATRQGASGKELADRLLAGDRLALARLMSAVESGLPGSRAALKLLYPHTGRAHIVGITGPPGSGKSTLTTRLAVAYRAGGASVGVVAVDPSSPFSGGAILGDRIRMMELHSDPEVFVRSMATRGEMGGIARTTMEVVSLLDAFGKDVVLLETVGVGQDEVDIARAADTTLVVGIPGMGDDVQAIKAGILEIADIFVVNKSDLDRAHLLVNDLRSLLSLAPQEGWLVPISETVATVGKGVPELMEEIARHRSFLENSGVGASRRAAAARRHVQAIVEDDYRQRLQANLRDLRWEGQFGAIGAREADPYGLAEEILTTARLTTHE